MTEIVYCRPIRIDWEGNPSPIYIFKTETGTNIGSYFICKAKEITWNVQPVTDTGGTTIRAEVETEPDSDGLIGFKKFIGNPESDD